MARPMHCAERQEGPHLHRIVLIAVLIALIATWYALRRQRVAEQELAISQFESKLMYPPRWNMDGHVRDLTFASESVVTDGDLQRLKHLAYLRRISLHGGPFTDEGLRSLSGQRDLGEFTIFKNSHEWPGLTDAGLRHLRGLRHLSYLCYVGARVTDVGLQHLEYLRDLRTLMLDCRDATDRGLGSLANLNRLEWLSLHNGNQMTGEGLSVLRAPEKLKYLKLDYVNDAGMRTIVRFGNLRELTIGAQEVASEGFLQLGGLTRLEKLTIQKASLDDRVIELLVERLPHLKELDLSESTVSEEAPKRLRSLKSLKQFSVPRTNRMIPDPQFVPNPRWPSPPPTINPLQPENPGNARFREGSRTQDFVPAPSSPPSVETHHG